MTDIHPIAVEADQEEVARQFERYNLTSAPVVDADQQAGRRHHRRRCRRGHPGRGVGGHSEDGRRRRRIGRPITVWETTRHRFTWLLVNLGTAILASGVIALFDATIEQMVALAVLMPIVASMGGNAGTQTMTVAVRAIATQDLGPVNAVRVIGRETRSACSTACSSPPSWGPSLFLVRQRPARVRDRGGDDHQPYRGGACGHSDSAWP